MQLRKSYNTNSMLLHVSLLLSVLTTAKSAEPEINMEAAFQGHCGHTSPCEQLCYEIHDGMYECDCIEGYELNKNGYSCQVINATMPSKSDEDVLYQKGVSFSAKLDANNKYPLSNSYDSLSYASEAETVAAVASSASYEQELPENEADKFFLDKQNQRKSEVTTTSEENNQIDNNDKNKETNSNDYDISAESIDFNPEPQPELELDVEVEPDYMNHNNSPDVPDNSYAKNPTANTFNQINIIPTMLTLTSSSSSSKQQTKDTQTLLTKSPSTTIRPMTTTSQSTAVDSSARDEDDTGGEVIDNYYNNYNMKGDISAYDDVNNNQLNLRPLEYRNTYKSQRTKSDEQQATNSINKFTNNDFTNNTNPMKWYDNVNYLLNKTKTTTATEIKNISERDCALDCGNDGYCDDSNPDNLPICLCNYGKTGKHCQENLSVQIPKFSHKSWLAFAALRGAYKHLQLHIDFRPDAFDGVLLLSGERDDLTGDFLALLLNKGFVEFWFDCGSGVGSVRSRDTIRLNEWNSVVIYRHRWDAWLILNHGSKVQGRSKGLFSRITFREPVFLGGSGNVTGLIKRLPVSTGFSGCIRRFIANDHVYNFAEKPLGDVMQGFNIQDCMSDKCSEYPCQHGGKCLPTEQGALCLCPMGFVGDLCEIRMDLQIPAFNGSSFLRHGAIEDTALIWLELKVILKPERPDGLIMYSGPKTRGDFIALTLEQGFVEFHFDLGSGPAIVRSADPLTMRHWHTIKISRTARLAVLKIDELPDVMTISPNGFWHLTLPESLFLGGVSHIEHLPSVLKSHPFFVGCIQLVDINGHTLSIISEALGGTNIGNCPHACLAMPCGAYADCLPQLESYECRCHDGHASCKVQQGLEKQPQHNSNGHKFNGHNNKHGPKMHKLTKLHKYGKIHKTTSQYRDVTTTDAIYDKNNLYDGQILENYESPYELKLKIHKHKPLKRKPQQQHQHHDDNIKSTNLKYTKPIKAQPMLRIPAHYASFQANGNILTFGDNVKIGISEETAKNNYGGVPFVIDENIFDDDSLREEYQHKQLAQDMRRIMANTPHHAEIVENVEQKADALTNVESTTQGATDWSMLKQLDLAADYQSHVGVRKNFGACFAGINSYFHYDDAETMRHIGRTKDNLNLRIKTHSTNGVLLWSGGTSDDFLALAIENGYLHFRYNLGAGEVDIMFNATKVSDGLWHRVHAIRDAHNCYLEVDGRKSAIQAVYNNLRQLNTNTGLYVGGLPDKSYLANGKYTRGIVGCISEIVLGGELKLNFDANTLGTAHNVETGIL